MTTLAEQWAGYKAAVLPGLRGARLLDAKRAFYAGASVVMVRGIPEFPVEAGDSIGADEAAVLNVFWREVAEMVGEGVRQ